MTVEALVWTADGRLFSAGQHAVVTEWDLRTLLPRVRLSSACAFQPTGCSSLCRRGGHYVCAQAAADSYGGPVWCMAANRASTLLAVGCEDGCVRLFDLAEGGLVYKRSFEPQKGEQPWRQPHDGCCGPDGCPCQCSIG